MTISKELINHILKKTQDPKEIAERLQFYQGIERNKNLLNQQTIKLRDEYEINQKNIKEKLKALRASCDHPADLIEFYSGYQESHRECGVCEYTW